MQEWWFSLQESNQILLITAFTSLVANIVVVAVGFWVTYLTSSRANREIAKFAADTATNQLKAANVQKIADFRLKWIEDLRECTALFCKNHYKAVMLRRDYLSSPSDEILEAIKETTLEMVELKRKIVLRISPETTDEHERNLLVGLAKPLSNDLKEGREQRVELEKLTGAILRQEWKKLNQELAFRDARNG